MKNSRRKAALVLAAVIVLGGCSGSVSDNKESRTADVTKGSAFVEESSETVSGGGGESDEPGAEGTKADASPEEDGMPMVPRLQQKIVTVTDIHYLAEEYSGHRGANFMAEVESGDGRVLQYGPEILDALIEDMLKEKPDVMIISGDLTLEGEKKSHEELAEKLRPLLDGGITVLVIPGNHDINNPQAKRFTSDGTEKVPSVTPAEFAQIYGDYGYEEAYDRDSASLSYVYELDDYYRIMMLDSCQYEPANLIGGMIRRETYDWIDSHMEAAWEEGAQFISVSHHNLLDQSGVSRDFYDNCTIEHNEELIRALGDGQVRLHLSGHLHLQHYMQEEEYGIYEIVTGSLAMTPCNYGVLQIMDTGTFLYDARPVDVDGWAKRHSYKNRDLADFTAYGEGFLHKVTYQNALQDLRQHTLERRLKLSDEKIHEMAEFYAKLCVHYYSGRMFEIAQEMKAEKAYGYWSEVDYVSELSDFLNNILNDDAKDFSHLEIPY